MGRRKTSARPSLKVWSKHPPSTNEHLPRVFHIASCAGDSCRLGPSQPPDRAKDRFPGSTTARHPTTMKATPRSTRYGATGRTPGTDRRTELSTGPTAPGPPRARPRRPSAVRNVVTPRVARSHYRATRSPAATISSTGLLRCAAPLGQARYPCLPPPWCASTQPGATGRWSLPVIPLWCETVSMAAITARWWKIAAPRFWEMCMPVPKHAATESSSESIP